MKTLQEKCEWASKMIVSRLKKVAESDSNTDELIKRINDTQEDWYDFIYELVTDTIDYSEYKDI